jgi:sugar lactone lactonase YvrE
MNHMGPTIETVLEGRVFGESARWHNGRLWFSDWGTQEIIAMQPGGKSEVMVRLPFKAFPFCFDWLPDGRLLIASASAQPLLRKETDGALVPHADLSGFPAYGWNEIVVDGRGNAYINGSDFDLMGGGKFRPGIIVMVTPDGIVRQVADGIAFPNGMAVTPNNATLILAESYGKKLTAFDIAPDGSLSHRRTWADLGDGVPDGICLDDRDDIWYGDVPNKRCVLVREGGEVLRSIQLDRGCFSCVLGGENKQTLFMIATEWRGTGKMFEGPPSGQVQVAKV